MMVSDLIYSNPRDTVVFGSKRRDLW